MTFHDYLQFSMPSSCFRASIATIEVCEAWWKRELKIKTDTISVEWKTLDYVQKALQAVEDVYLQQTSKTRKDHFTSTIINNIKFYSIDASFNENSSYTYNEFTLFVDLELIKRYQTYPIELNLWTKLVGARLTTLSRGILIREMNLSNANFLIDHLSIHVLFEHSKQELQATTEVPYPGQNIAILNDILKVCDIEFNYLEDFDTKTTSCHDMLNQTTREVVEMTTEVHEIMNDVESIAHQVDLGDETDIKPYLGVLSFFVRKLSLLQQSNPVSFPIKKNVVQEAFTLLYTGKKHRLDAFKDFEKDMQSWEKLMSTVVSEPKYNVAFWVHSVFDRPFKLDI